MYAVTPLLEDALMDRDLVHRQTACAAIKHMSLGNEDKFSNYFCSIFRNKLWSNSKLKARLRTCRRILSFLHIQLSF